MTPSRLIMLSSSGWHPRRMFAPADLGTIQNPSNLPSIYQDSNGVTAGAFGSVVGLVTDERYSLARGAEVAPALSAPNWVVTGTDATHVATFSNGTLRLQSDTISPILNVTKTGALTVGTWYEVAITVSSWTSGAIKSDFMPGITTGAAGTFTYRVSAAATYIDMYRAGTNVDLTIGGLSIKPILGNHASQATAGSRPTLDSPGKINYSSGTKSLVTTWASSLGSACTVAYAVPHGEAVILTGQTIGTSYTDTTDHCGRVIINRDITATETGQLRRWLNRRGAA